MFRCLCPGRYLDSEQNWLDALRPQRLLAFLLDSPLPENSTFYIFGQPFIIQDRIQQRCVFPLSVDDRDRNGTHIRHREHPIADDKIIALLGFGCPIAPASSLCLNIGTDLLSLSNSELSPSRYLRSTWLCGRRRRPVPGGHSERRRRRRQRG